VGALGINEIDLVVLNDVPPGLAARIVLDGLRLVVRDPEVDHRFVRDTLLRWGDLQPFLRRMRRIKLEAMEGPGAVTFLVERLAELRRHLDHLEELRPRVGGPADLERDLSLHNDVLFSLLTVSQLVIDIAGELSGRQPSREAT